MPQLPLLLVAINFFGAAALRAIKPNLATAFMMAVVVIGTTGYLGAVYGDFVLATVNRGRDQVLAIGGRAQTWSPQLGRRFPDRAFVDGYGKPVHLDAYRGRVVLLHTIGMQSPTSVAFAGGQVWGPFDETEPQRGLDSISTYARQFGRIQFDDDRLVVVHLILFNRNMGAPSRDELKAWERHFHVDRFTNQVVLGGDQGLVTPVTREMVPGFLLIDHHSIVRGDATGTDPPHDLYGELLPMIDGLLTECRRP